MKIAVIALLSLALMFRLSAEVLVDDTWLDADRTDTNLPEESAWYGSTAANRPTLSAAPGALTGLVRVLETNTTSRLWITHFTEVGTPAALARPGDTLKATLVFVPSGVTTNPATSRGFRVGLFNFSEEGARRVGVDGFLTGTDAPGANVTGYMLNLNFAQLFTINNPIEIMKRTDTANMNLMGASTVFTRVGATGGGPSGSAGYSNDVPYTLEFSAQFLDDALELTVAISDTKGWRMSHSVKDPSSPWTRFDSIAIWPNSVLDSAETFTFRELKVEHVPFVLRITRVVRNPEQFSLKVHFDSLPGKTYRLEAAGTADARTWDILGTTNTSGRAGTLDDPWGYFEDKWFYRVQQLP